MHGQTALAFDGDETLAEKWRAYHVANPHVWRHFERFALMAVAHRKRFGAQAIIERMRWELSFQTDDPEGFKINNNYTAYYAREFIRRYPQHRNLFRTRRTSSE